MNKKLFALLVFALLISGLLVACDGQAEVGTLQFNANGEDFVRQGFVSKDGWQITFEHVNVTLAEIQAYQTDPPYDAHEGQAIEADVTVNLEGTHTIDLAEGDEDAAPILVGEMSDVAVGHFNAVSFQMVNAPESDYTLVIVGAAERDGEAIDFTINVENEYTYTCGDFVGDERKGILAADGTADVEMTFHFDHVFGDADTPLDDDLNVLAPGFDPFAELAEDGVLDIDMAGLEDALSSDVYQILVDTLPTLGHVGEGHCYESQTG